MPPTVPTGARVELEVGAVAHGGHCVARHEGLVVFVRHALPGERVLARVTESAPNRSYLRADAVQVLRASPDRVEPPCPYARPGGCGGCDWQHASLPAQRALKAAVVREQLARLAGLDVDVDVEELPGAADGLGWRTRVQFAVGPDGVAGLRRHHSHEVEPVAACLIAHPLVEAAGVERGRWPGVGSVEVVASAATGRTLVLPRADVRGRGRSSHGGGPAGGPRRTGPVAPRGAHGPVEERAAGRSWRVGGGGFWQVHPAAADALSGAVLSALAPRQGETALDLYCGAGLFAGGLAVPVGPHGRVVGVEGDRQAAADARANLADLPWVEVWRAAVDPAVVARCPQPDIVVLDPPRSGAGPAVVAALASRRPRALAYVACDPSALARDAAALAAAGYRVTGLRAFDLFPMTQHVECVALFEPV